MQKPLYGLHREGTGKVLGAASFTHSYQMSDWLKGLDIRPGDKIEFQEVTVRPEFEEVPPAPAFIETPTAAPVPAAEDMPF